MAYEKTIWTNGGTPSINATNLNKIEQGIHEIHSRPNAKLVVPQDIPVLNFSGKKVVWGHANSADYGTHRMSYDTHGMFNASIPDELECKVSGKYMITVFLTFHGLTIGGGLQAEFFYSNYPDNELETPFDQSYTYIHKIVMPLRLQSSVELHQGDKLRLYVYGLNAGENAVIMQNGILSSWIAIECFELI
ncbi:hypothetical protein [Pseudobacteroides cellulosolvens]|uniref:Uncharacterized protein n=1 Tax=Pseudobacteroides cellulosolvens ATCC 35603 = DSM 2933 TaxID=398512 RepID=A0A0L6JG60_9FIRM|nr:hypothetical protein [Pseudobacteroides cellulosolvens]KNY24851.1 hypothetical protein Bccel_0108 [Pseudobacteroides cellulosolvens ATCC 35603 = DSM 2933]